MAIVAIVAVVAVVAVEAGEVNSSLDQSTHHFSNSGGPMLAIHSQHEPYVVERNLGPGCCSVQLQMRALVRVLHSFRAIRIIGAK